MVISNPKTDESQAPVQANVAVTQESYIKSVPEVVVDAMSVLAKKRKGRVEAVAVSQRGNA